MDAHEATICFDAAFVRISQLSFFSVKRGKWLSSNLEGNCLIVDTGEASRRFYRGQPVPSADFIFGI